MGRRTHIYFDDDVWAILEQKKNKSIFVNEAVRQYKSQITDKEQIKQLVFEILQTQPQQINNTDIEESINNLFNNL